MGCHCCRNSIDNYSHQREGDSRLEARLKSYELAARMQLSAPEAFDLSSESDHTIRLYGLDRAGSEYPQEINVPEETEYFGRKCLIARRLLERGVRFVQIWSGNDNGFPRRNWDSHEDIERDPSSPGHGNGHRGCCTDSGSEAARNA
jgi:hypothetical protein